MLLSWAKAGKDGAATVTGALGVKSFAAADVGILRRLIARRPQRRGDCRRQPLHVWLQHARPARLRSLLSSSRPHYGSLSHLAPLTHCAIHRWPGNSGDCVPSPAKVGGLLEDMRVKTVSCGSQAYPIPDGRNFKG